MDHSSSPIGNSQSSSKSNSNSRSLSEVAGEQPIKDINDPSANYDILFDQNVIGIWIDQSGNNVHSNDSSSDRFKTVVDHNSIKTESSDFSIILEHDEESNDSFGNELDKTNIHESLRNILEQKDNIDNSIKKQKEKEHLKQNMSNGKDINCNGDLSDDEVESPRKTVTRNSGLSSIASNGSEVDLSKRPTTNGPLMTSLLSSTVAQEERPQTPSNSKGFFSSWFGLSSSSTTKTQGTPEYYIEKLLQRSVLSKSLAERLQSLRVTLTTAKLSWIKGFIDGNGLEALESVLERYTTGTKRIISRNSDHDDRIQSECIQCLRVLLNIEPGFNQVLKSSSLINSIVFCLHTPNNKLRSRVSDVLAAICVMSLEGHQLVLSSFSDFKQFYEEKFRFQYLIESLKGKEGEEESSTFMEYKTACLRLVNAIVNSPEEVEERILLRDEFHRRGLSELFATFKTSNPPESLLNQINLYEEENQDDLDELYEKVHDLVRDANDPFSIIVGLIKQVEYDDDLYSRVIETLKNLLRIALRENSQNNNNWDIIELFIEKIKSITNINEEWQIFMNEFHYSIDDIVGEYSVIDGNVTRDQIDNMKNQLNELESKVEILTKEKDEALKQAELNLKQETLKISISKESSSVDNLSSNTNSVNNEQPFNNSQNNNLIKNTPSPNKNNNGHSNSALPSITISPTSPTSPISSSSSTLQLQSPISQKDQQSENSNNDDDKKI